MVEIDGSAGGGQLLRSSLSLSVVTDTPVTVKHIRGSRPEPGLKPQHLTAVEVLADICNATVEGATEGSEKVVFEPGEIQGGHVEAAVGTAGSLTLIFETILPLAVALGSPLSVTVSGGTAVKWSPPLTTYRHVKLPLCRQVGFCVAVERHRSGYYPAGGGKATLHLGPSSLSPIELTERGDLQGARVYSEAAMSLADNDVAQRQAETAVAELDAAGIDVLEQQETETVSDSPGSVLSIELVYENSRAGFDSLGERGKPAESVATEAAGAATAFNRGKAAVDRHLGDQLLLMLALAGGQLAVPERTEHVETSLGLLDAFGFDCETETTGEHLLVSVTE